MSLLDDQIRETREAKKHAIRYPDIMERYGVGQVKARKIIRAIRMRCGGGALGAGMVLPAELEFWENNPNKTEVKRL